MSKQDVIRYARASFTGYLNGDTAQAKQNQIFTATYWTKSKSGSDNIRAIFCGVTGKLKSVELL